MGTDHHSLPLDPTRTNDSSCHPFFHGLWLNDDGGDDDECASPAHKHIHTLPRNARPRLNAPQTP